MKGCKRLIVAAALLVLAVFMCAASPISWMAPSGPSSTPAPEALLPTTDGGGLTRADRLAATTFQQTTVLVGAGDIAGCGSEKDAETASLLDNIPGTIFTVGDNVYPDGTAKQFTDCYDPTWGRHKARTRPSPGNHDYHVPGASGYFNYFGAAAGEADKGYYSYDIGDWHIIALNSQCAEVGGCDSDSPQGQWLQADLAANPRTCTLAYWHNPRFSSGSVHGGDANMQDFWQLLYDARADVVLNGHEHNYERFAPQDPNGVAAPGRGIRQFSVGTGGTSLYPFGRIQRNSEVRNSKTHGVLKLTLHPTSYDWEFIPIAGQSFTDSGSASCVPPPNNAPVATDDTRIVAEGGTLNEPAPGVLSNDSDPENDPLTAVLDTAPAHGTLDLLADGSFTYTPTIDYAGLDTFTYHANDGQIDSNVATVRILVYTHSIYLPSLLKT